MLNKDDKRYVQIYTGNGKGKTTAALGLSLRASGHGLKTYFGQFMKGQHYGELTALLNHPHITIEQYGDVKCIHRDEVTREHIALARDGLRKVHRAIVSGEYDIVVLDEINVAVWFGMVTVEEVMAVLKDRPENVEVILTGRFAPEKLIEAADLVSEMTEVKHYYQKGILARDGIER